ncbi:VOC family protein [Burkholderia plantarii]|uniref:Putative glyoxalase/bleomycin resistance protein/dioxygenase domain protein n=1 Tax=Burkholderia plantarii TaxID=41899 RepID=A0A0B6S4J2_BURPL|nr:VOC family protein [Burkholderia plantarii]AJK48225.1 putative glyoxalase/bleomycin resistance protein/dioxygenase domain protein [Burkholderia plantarii]ALK32413.1 glyoxalase/bleomycin resistance protein/dioxygenase [Burkholderia plantarii]GLZ18960.1 glyoxalase [Burkholderia plantarii]
MTILGIEQITYGVDDLDTCRRFFSDWGMREVAHEAGRARFETLNGCTVLAVRADDPSLPPAFEAGPTLREVTWGVADAADLAVYRERLAGAPGYYATDAAVGCIDPAGMAIRVEVTRKRAIDVQGSPSNVWGQAPLRVDTPSPVYDHAEPIEVGHVVFFTNCLAEQQRFYEERLGFELSDRYPERGAFMRCAPHGGHHDIFLLALPNGRKGLNHVAFAVRDIHEVFGGGLHISRCGWTTQLGPGRHPVSSAYFWYFKNPAGGLIEYYADEDQLTPDWQPRDFEPGPTVFAEWAVDGGLDGHTRRQKSADAPEGAFMTERK